MWKWKISMAKFFLKMKNHIEPEKRCYAIVIGELKSVISEIFIPSIAIFELFPVLSRRKYSGICLQYTNCFYRKIVCLNEIYYMRDKYFWEIIIIIWKSLLKKSSTVTDLKFTYFLKMFKVKDCIKTSYIF